MSLAFLPLTLFVLVLNLVLTLPLLLLTARVKTSLWFLTILTATLSTGLFSLGFFLSNYFEIIMIHPSAYLIFVSPYAVVSLLISFVLLKFIARKK